jgi:hypothetical protein
MTPTVNRHIPFERTGDAAITIALLFEEGSVPLPHQTLPDGNVDVIKKKPVELALAWLVPAVGAAIFVTIQCFSYLNGYVGSGGTMKAIAFGPGALWAVSIVYGAWGVPPVLALADKRGADWAMLVIGGLLSATSTLGGVSDGLRDGGHLIALELLAVTLPAAVALVISWRHIRQR